MSAKHLHSHRSAHTPPTLPPPPPPLPHHEGGSAASVCCTQARPAKRCPPKQKLLKKTSARGARPWAERRGRGREE